MQDVLLDYLRRKVQLEHVAQSKIGDPVHIHSYSIQGNEADSPRLHLAERFSTDSEGVATSLGLQMDANVELRNIFEQLEAMISDDILLPVV